MKNMYVLFGVPLMFHFIKKLIDQCILYNAWKKTPLLDVVFGLCS